MYKNFYGWHEMYPFHHRFHYHRPSRILWFLIGAGAATWWIKGRHLEDGGHHFGLCRRYALQNPQANNNNNNPPSLSAEGQNPQDSSSFTLKDVSRTINHIPPAGSSNGNWSWGWGEKRESERWKEEQQKIGELSQQATRAVSDMTEATLDTLIKTAEALKTKLAENRTQQQKQEAAERNGQEKRNPS